MLNLASLLVTMNQFFGSPIQCYGDGGVIPAVVMNDYCWIHGTFTIPSQLAKRVGDEVAHPGVAPMYNPDYAKEKGHIGWTQEGDELRHAWYQWVCFILFIQAVLCYLPHQLWKSWEGELRILSQCKKVHFFLILRFPNLNYASSWV